MRKTNKIPRIIKINEIKGFKIYCAFNNGEHRIIDFELLFKKWDIKEGDLQYPLTKSKAFKQVIINEGTLQWPNIMDKIKLSNGMEFNVPFDLDPIVLYEESAPDKERNKKYFIGEKLKNARKKAGLTQEELAVKSGTTKNYISRIENNKSDIELGTLIKIIEIGLGRKLEINID
jgi:DNA-binding XRE family transcriptional regulator